MKIRHIYIIFMFILAACVESPQNPEWEPYPVTSAKGAVILCEGLWGQNNSSLTYYDIENDTVINNIFKKNNSGEILGDLANDMELFDGKLYVAITSGRDISKINTATFKLESRMILESNASPREISFFNGKGFFTDLYRNSLVSFDPIQMLVTGIIYSGPYPEGIDVWNGIIFTANSGLGDYHFDKPGAGTISVIDAYSLIKIDSLPAGLNAKEVLVNEKMGRLYAAFDHLPSKVDSVGGIVEYDLFSLLELRRWRLRATKLTLSLSADSLLFINDNDVAVIDLKVQSPIVKKIIINQNRNENWYSIAVSPQNEIWICNARNYNIDGEILIYKLDKNLEPIRRFTVGINPKKIIFR